MDQLTDQLYGSARQTSSLYLKLWPVRIFEDLPFSLYIVLASESYKGLVYKIKLNCTKIYFSPLFVKSIQVTSNKITKVYSTLELYSRLTKKRNSFEIVELIARMYPNVYFRWTTFITKQNTSFRVSLILE